MIRRKIDGNLERQFLAALISNSPFLSGAASLLDPELLPTRTAQLVAAWCLDYLREYGQAPGESIGTIYRAWESRENPKPGDAEAVRDFLDSIRDEPEPNNPPHLLDEFGKYLTARNLNKLRDDIDAGILSGDHAVALAAVAEFRSVSRRQDNGFSLLGKGPLKRAFADPDTSLIDFPSDSVWFWGEDFSRDTLIGIQGPEKRGKTYWLLEFLFRAIRSHRRVAMFEVGDLNERQLIKRVASRMARLPIKAGQCANVKVPVDIKVVDGKPEVNHRLESFPHHLDFQSAYKAQKRFNRTYKIDTSRPTSKFSIHVNGSISVAGIGSILKQWRDEENFVPDVILIDYADILAPENPRRELRDQIGETWRALRRLSQEWHACVVTATQANAQSYGVRTQGMKHFSGNKMKLAEVTAMIGLNQTETERASGVMRLNWIARREAEQGPDLWVAQCIPLGVALAKAARG